MAGFSPRYGEVQMVVDEVTERSEKAADMVMTSNQHTFFPLLLLLISSLLLELVRERPCRERK